MLQDDRVKGKFEGALDYRARQYAERKRPEWEHEWEQRRQLREMAERREQAIRDRDPDAALQVLSEQQAADRRYLEGLRGSEPTDHEVARAEAAALRFFNEMPEEARAPLYGKTYPGSKLDGIQAFHQDAVRALAKHEAAQERERWKKDAEPALRKELLSRLNGGEEPPDLGGGGAPGQRVVTDDDVGRMTLEEYDAHFDEKGRPKPGVAYRPGGKNSVSLVRT